MTHRFSREWTLQAGRCDPSYHWSGMPLGLLFLLGLVLCVLIVWIGYLTVMIVCML